MQNILIKLSFLHVLTNSSFKRTNQITDLFILDSLFVTKSLKCWSDNEFVLFLIPYVVFSLTGFIQYLKFGITSHTFAILLICPTTSLGVTRRLQMDMIALSLMSVIKFFACSMLLTLIFVRQLQVKFWKKVLYCN